MASRPCLLEPHNAKTDHKPYQNLCRRLLNFARPCRLDCVPLSKSIQLILKFDADVEHPWLFVTAVSLPDLTLRGVSSLGPSLAGMTDQINGRRTW
jgi:hypothetical protein